MNVPDILKQAFDRGEGADAVSRRSATELYRSVLAEQPTLWEAWFNLGVVLLRLGAKKEATECLERAEASPDLKIVAAYARLTTMMSMGHELDDSDFPPEFRGEMKGKLGVLGPCHNTATLFLNSGWQCRVEQSNANSEACSIITNFENQEYVINVSDTFGTLVKNTYKRVGGQELRLSAETASSDAERAVMNLPIGTMELLQRKIHS